ncbi:Ig-like domain-containing protein, partial [Salinicola sp. V024]|uniref:Ig-like domain-containing protein n=1 Tax=Salinicola sp. V024 TaxID=3459609 RepID=UPI004044E38A
SAVNGVTGSVGQAITGSNGGTFTLNADGSYSFNPGSAFDRLAAGQTDKTQISYTVSDGQGGTATSTLTVTVTGTNDAPVAVADTGSTGENATLNVNAAQGVLANDSDVDGGILSVSSVNGVTGSVGQAITGSNGGTFTLNADGSYSFNPGSAFDRLAAGQTDTTKVSYTVNDGQGGTATSTLTVTVTGTNDAPVAVADTGSTGENATLNVAAAQGVLANDSDVDGGTLSVSAVNGVSGSVGRSIAGSNGGTFTLNADGSYSFNPGSAFDRLAAGQTDTTKVSYTVSDGQGGTATSTLTVTVTGTNDAAVISGDTAVTADETNAALSLSGTLTASDVDNADNAFQATTLTGAHGTLALAADGSWTFTASSAFNELNEGDSVSDAFTVTSVDGTSQVVTVTINGTNDAAVISGDTAVTADETNAALSLSGTLTASDVDNADNAFQ